MSNFIARRLIVFAGSTQDPRTPTDPQVALIQGLVGFSLDPQRIQLEYPLLPPNSDFYDVLVDQAFDKSPYVVLYESEMYDTGEIIKRDLFGKGDYPLTWAGWSIPGDEPTEVAPSPQSREYKALAPVRNAKSKTVTYKGVDVKLERPK